MLELISHSATLHPGRPGPRTFTVLSGACALGILLVGCKGTEGKQPADSTVVAAAAPAPVPAPESASAAAAAAPAESLAVKAGAASAAPSSPATKLESADPAAGAAAPSAPHVTQHRKAVHHAAAKPATDTQSVASAAPARAAAPAAAAAPAQPAATAAPAADTGGKQSGPDSLAVTQQEYDGWKMFHVYCYRCHGVDAMGSTIAPNLRHSVSPQGLITHPLFLQTVTNGRPGTAMPSWKVLLDTTQMNNIYAYLLARSSGRLLPGRPHVGTPPK